MAMMITGCSPAAGFFGRVAVSNRRSESASQQELSSRRKANGKVEGLTAYQVAVLLAVGAAILSCL
jgi:hypothetical protein